MEFFENGAPFLKKFLPTCPHRPRTTTSSNNSSPISYLLIPPIKISPPTAPLSFRQWMPISPTAPLSFRQWMRMPISLSPATRATRVDERIPSSPPQGDRRGQRVDERLRCPRRSPALVHQGRRILFQHVFIRHTPFLSFFPSLQVYSSHGRKRTALPISHVPSPRRTTSLHHSFPSQSLPLPICDTTSPPQGDRRGHHITSPRRPTSPSSRLGRTAEGSEGPPSQIIHASITVPHHDPSHL